MLPDDSGPGRTDDGGPSRADQALVARGLARSRAVAREYIDADRVLLNDRPVRKPSSPVSGGDDLRLLGEPERYVGRAAYKLIGALDRWPAIPVAGRRCLDVGASTGGFTQVLLERDAAVVVALDVGHGQLAEPVRSDPRVIDRSGTSIRDVRADDLGAGFDLVVADLSFISLTLVLDGLAHLVRADGHLVLLVKPQFEVGRERLAHDGVVRSAAERVRAVRAVLRATEAAGLQVHGLAPSPVEGSHGNREYLLWLRPDRTGRMDPVALDAVVDAIGAGS